ncbi:DUF3511 domain protein (DUF3511) [Senna tora]|uniref:DUF3511 domain protein (DUF3511) n=1 Tax=Senna tora TaxID=362788 RepID=A0A834X3P5_9FABA|nr:DUF3511 domain protein (DUF3511) [Senna tora]
MDYYGGGGYGYGNNNNWRVEKNGVRGRRQLSHAPSWSMAYSDKNDSKCNDLNEAEIKRQKRVKKYKSYERERKIRAKIKKGFLWLKNKFQNLVHRD